MRRRLHAAGPRSPCERPARSDRVSGIRVVEERHVGVVYFIVVEGENGGMASGRNNR